MFHLRSGKLTANFALPGSNKHRRMLALVGPNRQACASRGLIQTLINLASY